jgi:hypothetical protein
MEPPLDKAHGVTGRELKTRDRVELLSCKPDNSPTAPFPTLTTTVSRVTHRRLLLRCTVIGILPHETPSTLEGRDKILLDVLRCDKLSPDATDYPHRLHGSPQSKPRSRPFSCAKDHGAHSPCKSTLGVD